jgi:glycerol-3-phosphate acyltransferase PlsX
MEEQNVNVCVDAMGGDFAPDVVLEGTEAALAADPSLSVLLAGPAQVVEPFAAEHERCTALVAEQTITMDEHPAQAVRRKKDSSIVLGCKAVREGTADGFFSAGSTGACLAAATMYIGRIKGIQRPCLCLVMPSPVKPVVMADVGANADCKPEYLLQFGRMATIFAQQIVGIEQPRAALLNIGSEDTKGSTFAQETFQLLKEQLPNFVGNAEGGDVMEATYDVIITDGFTGNVTLKTIEGTAKVLFKEVKSIMTSSASHKMAAGVLAGGFKELKNSVSPDNTGGSPLLGVKGPCVVGHGSSNPTAIKNGIGVTARCVRRNVCGLIEEAVG